MVTVASLTKEYHYKSKMLKKAQVHVKFPHIIYKRKSFSSPLAFFVHSFRLKGSHEHKMTVFKSIIRFMEALQAGKVDVEAPISYFPLYVLESRWLMRYGANRIQVLNTKGKEWLEAMQETVELFEEENEADRPII